MSDLRTLVFGDDGSAGADTAWLFVNSHAWPGWRLEVVTAQPPDVPGQPLPQERSDLHAWRPPNPRRVFEEARFAEVLELKAEADPRVVLSRESDLLVIGARGRGLLKALHIGSTADWLLLHPPAPLVIARSGRPVRRVVLCADGSPHADRVCEALVALPWSGATTITVLAVEDGRVDVDVAIARARERLDATGASVVVRVAAGLPTDVIHHHLLEQPADLVALGTRGLTGMHRLRLGSTAGAIARVAACSVLVACDETAWRRSEGGSADPAGLSTPRAG